MPPRLPRRQILALCLLGALLPAGAAIAAVQSAPEAAPPGAGMQAVTTLEGLPAQIRSDLGADDAQALSDRGGPFNPGCVAEPGKPNQRFMLAALGARRAVVAVESGGIVHMASSREYRLIKGNWTPVRTGTLDLQLAGQEDLLAQHARSARPVPARKKWF